MNDEAALNKWLKQVVAAGGEGLMLHRADALYVTGRSDVLLKLKLQYDAEATVVAHTPGRGKYAGKLGALVVDCSASAVNRRPIVPVFNGNTITPQFIRTVQPTFSAAMIAHVEASYEDQSLKNKLCTVVPLPDQPVDWLKMMAVNMGNQLRWSKDKELSRWIAMSRLDGFSALAASVTPEQPDKMALLMRYGKSAGVFR